MAAGDEVGDRELIPVMELLAPAGTIETFHAAIEAGADAVYVGAPGFNARNLARDLRLEEIGAMIRFCRDRGKKLYVAANSLILERELPLVVETLAQLEFLMPDALIVQDLGLIRLIRRYFPQLRLHASTLMTAHNSPAVSALAGLGCERVVLARELTVRRLPLCRPDRGRARGLHPRRDVLLLFRALSVLILSRRQERPARPLRPALPAGLYINRERQRRERGERRVLPFFNE